MVFSSIPAYYHDPTNWQQQLNQPTGGSGVNTSHLLPPPPPPPPPSQPHGGGGGGGGGAGTIRPGSLADRARMANIPMPEAALKCPRCESTNTKFCYFNNYSLSQPRHFCKTCRRYWTRGGSLRNVPVGGGCRRNRRSSKGGSSSKSPVSSSDHQMGTNNSVNSSSSITSNAIGSSTADILGLTQQIPTVRYMAGLSNLTEFPSNEIGLNYGINNYGGLISSQMSGLSGDLNFQIGSGLLGGHGASRSLLSDQWRLQPPSQFPFLAGGLDPSSGFYEGGGGGELLGYQVRPKPSSSGLTQQMASVKMEEDRINFSRQLFGSIGGRNDQYWNDGTGTSTTAAWTDASGFNSSS